MAIPAVPKSHPVGTTAVRLADYRGVPFDGRLVQLMFFVSASDDPVCARLIARCAAARGRGMVHASRAAPDLVRVKLYADRLPLDFHELLTAATGDAVVYVSPPDAAALAAGGHAAPI